MPTLPWPQMPKMYGTFCCTRYSAISSPPFILAMARLPFLASRLHEIHDRPREAAILRIDRVHLGHVAVRLELDEARAPAARAQRLVQQLRLVDVRLRVEPRM